MDRAGARLFDTEVTGKGSMDESSRAARILGVSIWIIMAAVAIWIAH